MKTLLRNCSLVLVLSLLGCANLVVGQPIPKDKLELIVPGRTTSGEIQDWFGKPLRTAPSGDAEICTYRYMDGKSACDELTVSITQGVVSNYSTQ